MSGNVLIDRKKVKELLDQLRLSIPQEIRAAEEILSEKDQIINIATVDARRVKAKAEDEYREKLDNNQMVLTAESRAQDTARDAEERATRLVHQSEAEAQVRKTEADTYALRSLRALERELSTLTSSVRKGIDLLANDTMAIPNGHYAGD